MILKLHCCTLFARLAYGRVMLSYCMHPHGRNYAFGMDSPLERFFLLDGKIVLLAPIMTP